ncbi:AraC family transcriptional regulator [Paenibacillus sp. ACRRX]|uniref:AraC family transcriptional regulator n=1 Tax=Paenibacillus sp. ACRRX TaxID=2918206 RepID=UPI001EF62E41|nr:AraC family transcriptional regulator [Paenibacillus sp. ACRRX]MCG7405931.1 AraC family transcriptional regulator [Paenibacillus sp. ACRRX]
MKLNDHILLWNHVFIKVMDVRHVTLHKDKGLRNYRLPTSAFLYTIRGNAQIWLDQSVHKVERFHVLHGGKGMCLNIVTEDELEYYLILYKTILALPSSRDIQQLLERENPFQCQYAFAPHQPLSLYDKVELLEQAWRHSTELGNIHVKALLYQFVYELLAQLHRQGTQPLKPDLMAQAVAYMHEHYRQPLTLESIAEQLGCSAGHMSRTFKKHMHTSPIHYLGQVRAERTMQLLMQTDATLQEIAERVGYPDAHSLSRSFKKYIGLSPVRFKKERLQQSWHQDLPTTMLTYAVQQKPSRLYNDIDYQYRYKARGDIHMQGRIKVTAMTVVLCLSLLLAACSTQANTTGGTQTEANQTTAPTTGEKSNGDAQAGVQAKTRTVSTLKGDVEIPAEPKRVVSDQYMGHLLKLGIIPVGVRSFMLSEAWIEKAGISKDLIAGIEDLGAFPMNLEKLTYLEPDLIIGSMEKNIEDYQKIGKTVFLPYWEGLSTAGPLEKFRRISEIFGKEQQAEQWITGYKQNVEDAKKKIAGIIKEGETVSIVQVANKTLYVLAAEGGNYGSSTIYEMLGLPPTKKALDMKEGFETISLEVLPEYAGDHIFVYGSHDKGANDVLNSSIWKGLAAVKKGNVYMYGSFDDKGDEFVMEDPYSLELQLDSIVNLLLANKK